MSRAPWRDHIVTTLIAFVSTFFGVALIQGSQLMVDFIVADDPEAAGMFGTAVLSVAVVFIGIGAYTAAVVTANTFSTIVAGRVRTIAQYRLLGQTAGKLRANLASEGLVAGLVGTLLGLASALVTYRLLVQAGIDREFLPTVDSVNYTWVAPAVAVPAVISVLTVWVAAYVGSRAVSKVSPVQALSAHVEAPVEERRSSAVRKISFALFMAIGVALLLGGCALGVVSPMGVLVAFWGGVFSFTAVVIGAVMIVPRLLALIGRCFGSNAAVVLARGNVTRAPRAATRATIGMIIGVALIVMFVVALATMKQIVWTYLLEQNGGQVPEAEKMVFDQSMMVVNGVMISLTCVSVVLAAIGMISNLALAVIQRRRELGLLRAVGATSSQIRLMILVESAVTSIVAIGFGAILGILYGWAGAQSTFGVAVGGFALPVVPWELPVAVAAATITLALVAAIGPSIRATKVSPVEALAVS